MIARFIHAERNTIALLLLFAVCSISSAQSKGLESGRQEFLDQIQEYLPDWSGGIIVTYETSGNAANIRTAGYDAINNAWFLASHSGCAGRAIDGWHYRAGADDKELADMAPYFGELISIAEEIPWCFLIAMRDNPEMVVDAELMDDGVWSVLYHAIDPAQIQPDRAPWQLKVDARTGHVLSNQGTDPNSSPAVEFDWEGTPLGLRVKSRTPFTRVRTRLDMNANEDEFLPERVFQRMKEHKIRVDQKLSALSSGYVQNESGEWVADDSTEVVQPYNDLVTRRFRVPLLIAGGLVILIGVVQVYRRGRAA